MRGAANILRCLLPLACCLLAEAATAAGTAEQAEAPAPPATLPAPPRPLTVVSRGGTMEQAQRDAYFIPFAARTGLPVDVREWSGGIGALRSAADSGTTPWDVVQVEETTLLLGCAEGLFETMDFDRIGGKARYQPQAVSQCGVGTAQYDYLLSWDRTKLPSTPSWADFWDVAKFPGKRGLPRGPRLNLEIALMADGVAPADVYKVLRTPDGVERAFRKLDQLKPYIVWWDTDTEAMQVLTSGQVLMTVAPNGAVVAADRAASMPAAPAAAPRGGGNGAAPAGPAPPAGPSGTPAAPQAPAPGAARPGAAGVPPAAANPPDPASGGTAAPQAAAGRAAPANAPTAAPSAASPATTKDAPPATSAGTPAAAAGTPAAAGTGAPAATATGAPAATTAGAPAAAKAGAPAATATGAPAAATVGAPAARRFGMQWNGGLIVTDFWAIMHNSPHLSEAYDFLDFAGDPARQAAVTAETGYAGLAKGAGDKLPAEVQAVSSGAPAHVSAGMQVDAAFWRDNLDKMTQRFNAWLAAR